MEIFHALFEPADGSHDLEFIQKLFLETRWEACISPSEKGIGFLKTQERAYAEESSYLFWIGNVERFEDGIRCRCEMKLEKESCRIVLTITDMDSAIVKEAYAFGSETGGE